MLHMSRSGRRLRFRAVSFTRQELVLVAVAVLWGATFLVIHTAMDHSGPWFFVGLRFLTAGLFSIILFHRVLRGMCWRDLGAGLAIGVTISASYGLQTVGLQTVSSSTSAFITAMYVPLVPLIQWVVLRRRPGIMTMGGAGLAFVGLILFADLGSVGFRLGEGEVATLLSTLPLAAEIILIGFFAGRVHLGRVTIVQLVTAGLLALAAMPVAGESVPEFSWVWLLAGVGLGAASCIIQLAMNWAQRTVSPTRATIIYAGEPVWGGVFGRLAGDRLPPIAVLGAAFIVAGVLVSELKPRPAKRESATEAMDPV